MRLDMARFLKDKEQLVNYFARENIVPVKAPPWAKPRFELRRNTKQPGHLVSSNMLPVVLEALGVQDERSCKDVREHIKHLRKVYGYK
ncbi:unnamed protein product [marine sediment metagenome]|uniref:Uncharacterized protein n=1 Tax=marine sediment metagenome TaxID=412755 RepID=X1A9T9_9ZZZZ